MVIKKLKNGNFEKQNKNAFPKIRFLAQKVCSVVPIQTQKGNTEDNLSGVLP